MDRSRGFMILMYIGLTLVVALACYWLLTIVAPPPAGWSDDGVWLPVHRAGSVEHPGPSEGAHEKSRQGGDHLNGNWSDQSRQTEGDILDGHHQTLDEVQDVEEHADPDAAMSDRPPPFDHPDDATLIWLNSADVQELQQLPGIGPVKAQSIVDYRRVKGAFDSLDELLEVKGIGEKTLANIRSHFILD